MSGVADDELAASATPGYKGPGQMKTEAELQKLDYRDDSLKKWEASLGLQNGAGAAASGPKMTPVELRLTSASRAAGPIVFDLKQGAAALADLKKNPVNIKEGAEYSVSIIFVVNHSLISGLKYIQVVKRSGIKVDKLEQMLGSYSAGPAVTKKFLDEEAPSGMIARSGMYAVRSRLVDDDNEVHLDFEWSFKLTKEW